MMWSITDNQFSFCDIILNLSIVYFCFVYCYLIFFTLKLLQRKEKILNNQSMWINQASENSSNSGTVLATNYVHYADLLVQEFLQTSEIK